jgi:hypothetical protein
MSDQATKPSFTGVISGEIISKSTVHYNLGQDVIIITEDRMRLKIDKHLRKISEARFWVTPLSVVVPIVLALLTADFHDWLLGATLWKSIFLLAAMGFGVWTIVAIVKAVSNRTNVDDLIHDLKSAQAQASQAAPLGIP